MYIKEILDEDFVNYKKPSMFIAFPTCTFKCEKECGKQMCQNSSLMTLPNIVISNQDLAERYTSNPITSAVVCGGLEPMDSFEDLISFIHILRYKFECQDDVVIYTGYTENECEKFGYIKDLRPFGNIIIKFGRYRPYQEPHFDEVLGVKLASDNQYAKII